MSSSASSRLSADRIAGGIFVVLALFAPLIFTEYWVATLLTQMLFLGVVAASLIFLSAYGGMVSLGQVSLYGVAGFVLGNLTTNGNTKGLNLGWAEAPGIVVALVIAVIRRLCRANLRAASARREWDGGRTICQSDTRTSANRPAK